jgi:NTP pyrophosphatase (non-canonical NTP hydrolase)
MLDTYCTRDMSNDGKNYFMYICLNEECYHNTVLLPMNYMDTIPYLKCIQLEQLEWQKRNFPTNTQMEPLLGIVEEVGELCHAVLKQHQGIRINEDHEAAIKDAIGDIMIYMLGYCNLLNYDLEKILAETWKQVKERDWQKNKENGQ